MAIIRADVSILTIQRRNFMQRFSQLSRSYVTLSLLTFMLVVGLSGMVLADEKRGETGAMAEPMAGEKIDVNTATAEQLQEVKGIGPKKAEEIVKHRTDKGDFKSVDDLANVKGIGEATVEKIKDQVMVGTSSKEKASE